MCGIVGIRKLRGAPVAREDLFRMASTLVHRGPDDAGYCLLDRGSLGLGHTRLSILDLATGQQPMFSADGRLAIVFNGEIYDHQAHRAALLADGVPLRTTSDTEVILGLYQRNGLACLDRLNGEFAFLLWDDRARKLIAVRDRAGVKPLFYATRGDEVLFASEAKAIAALPRWDRRIAKDFLTGPFFACCASGTSVLEGVQALRAGHLLVVGPDGVKEERPWWRPRYRPVQVPLAEAATAVRETLTRAVLRRLVADVPVCGYLSGGLDSSIVLALMARERPVRAFTVAFSGSDAEYDESQKARATARHLGVELEVIDCPLERLAEDLETAIFHSEMYIGNPGGVGKVALSRAASRAGFKVALTGEGADEVFAGYPYFKLEQLWRMEHAGGAEAAQAARLWPQFVATERRSEGLLWNRSSRWRRAEWLFGWPSFTTTRAEEYARLIPLLFRTRALGIGPDDTPLNAFREALDLDEIRALHPLHGSLRWSLEFLAGMIIPVLGDRPEMASSMEGRTPFLDRDVLELSFTLPPGYLLQMDQLREKHVLREAFAGLLPEAARVEKKNPFFADNWRALSRTRPGRERFEHHLSRAGLARTGIFNPSFVQLVRAIWALSPRRSVLHARLDVLIGVIWGVQVLHEMLVERTIPGAADFQMRERAPA